MDNSDSLRYLDASGDTVDEAIQNGLNELGLNRSDVIIEIVSEGNPGMFGTDPEPAQVRLTPLRMPAPQTVESTELSEGNSQEEVDVASDTLRTLLDYMQIDDATIHIGKQDMTEEDTSAPWILDIRGSDMGQLIGRKGETLEALQYVTRLIVSRETKARANFIIDVEGYKARREQSLYRLAERMAAQARRMNRTVSLEPMPPNERRIIHIALRNDNTVETESVGTGNKRKVTIRPV